MVPPPAAFLIGAAASGAAKVALEERALNAGAAGFLGAVLGGKQLFGGLETHTHTYRPPAPAPTKKPETLFLPPPPVSDHSGIRLKDNFSLTETETKRRRKKEEYICCYDDMPYKSYRRGRMARGRRCYRKKVYRRKRSIPYAVPARSQVVKFEMLTAQSVSTHASTAGLLGSPITFTYNDVFSPDQSATSIQPAGLDQWNNFYTHATVLWSKIEIVASSTVNDELIVGVTRIPYTRAQTGQQVPANGDSIRQWGLDRSTCTGVISGDNDTTRLVLTSNIRKCENVSDLADNRNYASNISASGAQGASCTNKGLYYIWAVAHDATTAQAVRLWVKVTYITRLHDPRVPDLSASTT